ncbi:DUF697 domain-containing protein [Roseibium sp.]|uniref:DUF697 domain-containing protein n=1 Tax=Roseibium sp. TaxID=1936156 RepID=UPI003A96B892
MTKQLPKTSTRTLDDLRRAANLTFSAEQQARRPVASPLQDVGTPKNKPDQTTGNAPREEADASPQEEQSSRSKEQPALTARQSPPGKNEFRRNAGQLVIDRHVHFATIAGLVPMPWVDLAAIAAIVERMLRKLSRLYGQPISTHRSKRLAAGLVTGMAAPGIASFTLTGLLRIAPGPHLLGMAITSVSAAVLVRVVGEVYLSRLDAGAEAIS